MSEMGKGTLFNLRNVLILVGVIITGTGLVYFASQFIDRISDWGRVAALALLAVHFIALGRHFEQFKEDTELVHARGWRWLRVTTALYVLGILSAFTAFIVFFGIDDVDRLVKALVAIVAGLALILVAARWFEEQQQDA